MPNQQASMRTQAILGKYLGQCQAIQDAVTAAEAAKESAEDRYANARTQQQAEAAEADIKSAIKALAQVFFCCSHCGSKKPPRHPGMMDQVALTCFSLQSDLSQSSCDWQQAYHLAKAGPCTSIIIVADFSSQMP